MSNNASNAKLQMLGSKACGAARLFLKYFGVL
jgi:hypothetical protein